MHREPVESSNLATVGFSDGVLEIEFRHGGVYQYFNVPASVYEALMAAESKGKYFIQFIKDKYEFIKL
jgi:hypothetical protein